MGSNPEETYMLFSINVVLIDTKFVIELWKE